MVPASFFASFFLNINVLVIILFCSSLCFIQAYIKNKERGIKYD